MTTAPTIRIDIFMAGDLAQAKQVCREFCRDVGLCVHLEPVDFIYTGGEESGFKVGLINYPKYPSDLDGLTKIATDLAECLRVRLCQDSYSITAPLETIWFSTRPAEQRRCIQKDQAK